MDKKLPPLKEVDPEGLALGRSETTELNFPKCKHDLQLISSTECKCRLCGVGWTGPNIIKLVIASKAS